jgi:hypothetical protein
MITLLNEDTDINWAGYMKSDSVAGREDEILATSTARKHEHQPAIHLSVNFRSDRR